MTGDAMQEQLQEILQNLPKLPGIYLMKDAAGVILYVGKAKSLHTRVRSYFQDANRLPPRTRVMVSHVRDIKFLTTETEGEALILESNFIKQHQPRYNVLLKDDKNYPYIKMTMQELYPRLEVTRRVKKDGAEYFGPYTMVKEVRETIRLIYKIFPLRQSRDVLDGGKLRRPCLNYQMGRCLAPCAALVSPEEYGRVARDVTLFLRGKNSELLDSLRAEMSAAAAAQEYEKAAVFRDKIAAVQSIFDRQKVVSAAPADQDVIACHVEGELAFVQVLIVREGKMIGEKNFKMKSLNDMGEESVLSSFLKQYYGDDNAPPDEILLSHPVEDMRLIGDWLSERKKQRIALEAPERGKKRGLAVMARENARLACKSALDSDAARSAWLDELKEKLHLRDFPSVIEAFDISNISGLHAVGSMVSFVDGRAEKSGYRHFKIQETQGIDDYAMLREVLARRYARLLEEGDVLPDLVFIDGGKGHLRVAVEVLDGLGLLDKIDVACIAKGKRRNDLTTDEIFIPRVATPILFREHSPARLLLQRIRDEAHRFAVTFHRKLRGRSALVSPLERVRGIGKKRRLMLLKKFGSLENIRNAPLDELQALPGITAELAAAIAAAICEPPAQG